MQVRHRFALSALLGLFAASPTLSARGPYDDLPACPAQPGLHRIVGEAVLREVEGKTWQVGKSAFATYASDGRYIRHSPDGEQAGRYKLINDMVCATTPINAKTRNLRMRCDQLFTDSANRKYWRSASGYCSPVPMIRRD